MSPSLRNLFLIVCIILIAGGGAYYFANSQEGTTSADGPPRRGGARAIPVMTATVKMEDFVDSIEAIGTAQSNESISVTAKLTEKLSTLNFEDGQFVKQGDIIAELVDVEASADLAEARATLRETELQYERVEGLFRRGNTTKAALDSATSAKERAQARVGALEARLADRLIRAPFSGVLGLRMVSPGTLVRPGDEITTLDDISVIKLDFSVPETFLGALRVGLEVTAKSAAYPDKAFVGTISAIGTRIDPSTRAAMIRAEIPNPDGVLKPGMLMTTTVLQNKRQSMTIPERALVPIADKNFVFVVRAKEDQQTVDQVEVKIGGRRPGYVEILAGVELGDQVVTEGTNRVRPGGAINVLPSEGRPNV